MVGGVIKDWISTGSYTIILVNGTGREDKDTLMVRIKTPIKEKKLEKTMDFVHKGNSIWWQSGKVYIIALGLQLSYDKVSNVYGNKELFYAQLDNYK